MTMQKPTDQEINHMVAEFLKLEDAKSSFNEGIAALADKYQVPKLVLNNAIKDIAKDKAKENAEKAETYLFLVDKAND